MARVVALTDSEAAMGFRLAGIDTLIVQRIDEVGRLLTELLEKKEPGVVIFDENYLKAIPEKLQKRIDDSLKPVFIPVPHVRSWREGEKKEEYLARLLRRAIGYQIKVKR